MLLTALVEEVFPIWVVQRDGTTNREEPHHLDILLSYFFVSLSWVGFFVCVL
jgi:hypothetical protein